ncbi:hypothetical protein QBL02_02100 [Leucobacter sp. UT-8R-CII-1-4]|uniref:hypothetical protein n=1 Tax=Leucobacter sp. UT-8R-CII-1-4 TaxID=3040075 RepID=UPI0024A8CB92|nr:hypothetical protein [Leucobacter sp. UT-8R-CII-1-4]MDI6022335.1 hypothetical protein [Leucobacter sp. UT-8R-CII-1-4]
MAVSSTQPSAPRKRQHRWIAALVALGLTATGVVAYTAAANAATELTTYVSSAAGATSQVNATVLTSSSTTLAAGYYVCNSTLTINSQVTIADGAPVSIILGDSCSLTINSAVNVGGTGIKVPSSSSLVFYSQMNNTGKATVTSAQGPAIGSANQPNGPITFNGGHVGAFASSTIASIAYPGIGTSGTSALPVPGTILIRWNASVYAKGSDGTAGSAAGPGIGTAAANIAQNSTALGTISVGTTGAVMAVAGAAGSFAASPNIGRGSWNGGSYNPTINTYTINRAYTGPGRLNMRYWDGNQSPLNSSFPYVAAGSNVTFVAIPDSGAKLRAVDTGLTFVSTDGVSSTYRLPVTGAATKGAYFWYSTTPTVTTTPAGSQTYPGNVTINGSITQDSTSALIASNGQAQLWINGALAQTQNVTAGKVAFTHASPPVGNYSYQIKYLGTTSSPYLASSESVPLTGFEVLGTPQNSLSFTGLDSTNYTYGDAPAPVTVTGGSGTGVFDLISSDPAVASFGPITAGAGTLTINQAGTFTVTGTRAGDTNYAEATLTSPPITVTAATPVATLTRTGGDTVTTPIDATMTVNARGTGSTPQGYVQFSLNNKKLGDPLPLVDNGDGTASVSLTGIPLASAQSQSVEAVYLGQTGKYTTVTKTSSWYLGADGFCLAETPPTP